MKKSIKIAFLGIFLFSQSLSAQNRTNEREAIQVPPPPSSAKRAPCEEIKLRGMLLKQVVDALQKEPNKKALIDNIYLRATELKHTIDQFPECSQH